jgi:hypothetical protein
VLAANKSFRRPTTRDASASAAAAPARSWRLTRSVSFIASFFFFETCRVWSLVSPGCVSRPSSLTCDSCNSRNPCDSFNSFDSFYSFISCDSFNSNPSNTLRALRSADFFASRVIRARSGPPANSRGISVMKFDETFTEMSDPHVVSTLISVREFVEQSITSNANAFVSPCGNSVKKLSSTRRVLKFAWCDPPRLHGNFLILLEPKSNNRKPTASARPSGHVTNEHDRARTVVNQTCVAPRPLGNSRKQAQSSSSSVSSFDKSQSESQTNRRLGLAETSSCSRLFAFFKFGTVCGKEKCQSRVGRVLDVYWTCIGRCVDSSQGNRYVYWTMYGQQSP